MLKTEGIEKSFDKRKVLQDINLELEPGHIFGLLGTNGAGKSTLLRIMSGIIRPEKGRVWLEGRNVIREPDTKNDVCYVSDDPAFLHGSTIREMGRYQQVYFHNHDAKRLEELCERFSLPMDERISGMSKGTQKRVQVSLALARRPKVLLCDETFDGLDPVMRETFRKTVSEETCDRGTVTVLAGHNQQEMEGICDSVGFLHEGKLLTVGDIESVVSGLCRVQFATEEEVTDEQLAVLKPLRTQKQGKLRVLTMRGSNEDALAAVKAFDPVYTEVLPLSLEEVFILEMEEQGYAWKE